MEQVKAKPVAWQRRFKFQLTTDPMGKVYQWESCTHKEATGHFERKPGYEYRPLYANPQPAAVDGLVEQVSDMMREVFISGADWGRTRPGHFSDYLADAIKPHLEALTKIKQP